MRTGRNGTQQKVQLSSRQMRALWLYAQGSTDAEVATELGVERSTAWCWRTADDDAPVAVRLRAAEIVLHRSGIQSSDGERTAVTSSIGDLLDD